MADPVDVLDFWLGEVGPSGWYVASAELDDSCRAQFAELWQAAFDRGLEHWVDGPAGTLAYLIVCDQLARNIHRGDSDAFATDAQALVAAHRALSAGWDVEAPEPERQFFYMPFMHSEHLPDQDLCIDLFTQKMPLTGNDQVVHARAHRAIIARFGRFPFRNLALGRTNTDDEAQFLANGSYGEVVNAIRASHAPFA